MTLATILALASASAEIVVTGRALPPIESASPSRVVLDWTTLGRVASLRLEHALADVPGIQTFRRADSGSAHPTTAGLTARGLGGNASSRMLLVFDGVPQSDPFGGWVDFPLYSLGRMGSVAIERGGGQSRWGSGAIAGTIEIVSRGPGDGPALSALARNGSSNSIELSGDFIVGNSRAYLLAGAALRRSDGFVPIVARDRGSADIRAPYRQANGALRGAIALSPNLELQGGVQLVNDHRTRGLADSANHTRGGDASLRLVGRGAHPFQLTLYSQVRRFSSLFAAVSADRSTSRVTLDQYRVPTSGWGARGEVDLLTGPIDVRLGADFRTGTGTTNERYQFVNGAPSRERRAGGDFVVGGLFAQSAWQVKAWRLSLDARIDRWGLSDGRIREAQIGGTVLTDVDFPDRQGWQSGGRVALAHMRGRVTIEAAASRGWRLPTLNELYRPFRVGPDAVAANAALDPERLLGGEIGAALRATDGFEVKVTMFANRLSDAVANVTLGEGPGVFPGAGFVAAGGTYSQRRNVRAIKTVGAELSADLSRGPWSAGVSASLVRARVYGGSTALALDGKRPAQIPRIVAVARAAWTRSQEGWAAISLRYEGARFDDDLNSQRLRGALTFDGSAQWPLNRGLAITGAVENLFGAEAITGFSGSAQERSQGRTFWLGLSIRG